MRWTILYAEEEWVWIHCQSRDGCSPWPFLLFLPDPDIRLDSLVTEMRDKMEPTHIILRYFKKEWESQIEDKVEHEYHNLPSTTKKMRERQRARLGEAQPPD